jgi:sporulation related protein
VQVLDPSAQAQSETVMPEPEQPITPPAAEAPTAEQAPTVVENTESNAAPAAEAPAADVAPSPDVPLAETPLPAMEENGTTAPAAPAAVAPDQTQTAEAPAATEPAPAATAETTPAPAATPEPAPEAAVQPEPAQAAQPEQPATQEAPAQQAAITPVAPTGNSRVQLAAGKSEASVQKEWAALQKAHPDLLGPLSLHIERVDKGASGIFYRLQAGPLADKTAAKELCASLKQKGQDCLVVAK